MNNPRQAIPAIVPVATTDNFPITCNLYKQVPVGQTATSPSCILTDLGTNQVVSMDEVPTVVLNGRGLQLLMEGDILTPGHTYQLTWVYTTSGNQISVFTEIVCPA